MGKNLSFVEQFNRCDSTSNNEIIELVNGLSGKQKKALVNMVNSKNKELR
jgi:hypothetical protein